MAAERWLLFMQQIPAKPDYLRVKLWRRLQRLRAIPLKNSVWALPDTDAAMEDFQWLRREVENDGGEAIICRADLVAGVTDEQRTALIALARKSEPQANAANSTFTGAAMTTTDTGIRGRTWVTRSGVGVDRIASAWLIRRFIDPQPRFRFVPGEDHVPVDGEIRFDMYEAEYTHVGDACTFEVLASTFAAADPVLAAIGEVVHDIDLKDSLFGRSETAGVAALIDGICAAQPADDGRLERGFRLFDDLYAAFAVARGTTP
jgi:hypothetical protein